MIDLSVLKSDDLDLAVQEFEAKNGKLEEVCPTFVDQFVAWIKECLTDEDNFPIEIDGQAWTVNDKAEKIYNLFSEDCTPHSVDNLIDELEDKLHSIKVCDEIDNFIMALIEAIVQADTES